jgi:CheY-like chemotaxis protein
MADVPGILIVDDNEDNRYTLQLLLESDGHERIASAASGNEAIALLEKQKFSLVLLDLMMPDLNGDEVLKLIKSDPDKRDIPVVMLSADTHAEKVAQCVELGADDYLPKPFNPTILRARIAAALRRHSLRALENEYLGKIENEKRHSENLLRNILPTEIVTRLRNGESNIADHFEDATVIFADVVGFGKITARMKAFEIVACLKRIRQSCRRRRDRKDQDDRRQLHGGLRRADAASQSRSVGREIRPRHGCSHRAIAIALAGAFHHSGGAAFRPGHGRSDWHAQVRLRRLGQYRQHCGAHGGGERTQSRACIRGDRAGVGKRLQP